MPSHTEMTSQLESYFDRLWPLLRSLTGQGVRDTHKVLSELVPLETIEIPSGTQVFDWTVPKEWVVREAYVVTPDGERILDVHVNNLHLVSYSVPFVGILSKSELDQHLYSLPDMPDAIPYVTSYYAPRWGFCLSERQRRLLPEGDYQVVIDTDHIDGSMTLSEAVLPGEEHQEVLISTYTCHPSLANNELSGPLVSAFLFRRLAALPKRRLTYRFVFLPETIGAIAYLQRRGEHFKKHLIAGYVVTCVGDRGPFTYKKSRQGTTAADQAALHILSRRGSGRVVEFVPAGSDERQYCSPGFNLPVGSIMRSMYGTYMEYHTSLDNKDFISFQAMQESISIYFETCCALEVNRCYITHVAHGEPQLGKRGLYPSVGTNKPREDEVKAMMWVINFSDGDHDLLSIADRSGFDVQFLAKVAKKLVHAGVLSIDHGGASAARVPLRALSGKDELGISKFRD